MNPLRVSDDVRLTVPFGHLASSIALASVLPCRDCVQPIDQTTSAARGLSERADPRARANTALVLLSARPFFLLDSGKAREQKGKLLELC